MIYSIIKSLIYPAWMFKFSLIQYWLAIESIRPWRIYCDNDLGNFNWMEIECEYKANHSITLLLERLTEQKKTIPSWHWTNFKYFLITHRWNVKIFQLDFTSCSILYWGNFERPISVGGFRCLRSQAISYFIRIPLDVLSIFIYPYNRLAKISVDGNITFVCAHIVWIVHVDLLGYFIHIIFYSCCCFFFFMIILQNVPYCAIY